MARVTVEDCMKVVENRFELVALASQRAKDITAGAPLTVERDNDKNAVIALREIAQGNIDVNVVREVVVRNLQRRGKFDSHEEESIENNSEENLSELDMELIEDMDSLSVTSLSDEGDLSFDDDNLDIED